MDARQSLPRAIHGDRHRSLQDFHLRPARHHRQSGARRASDPHPRACCARMATIPYLVVAADKGTATFSDIANGIAQAHGFWLDDAFASGGSKGYDHKKMGITARGAWEAIKRHFREMGTDIQKEDFTVIGVGDSRRAMSSATACCCRIISGWSPLSITTPHLYRSQCLDRGGLQGARTPVRAAPLKLGRLRQEADRQGRRHFPTHPQEKSPRVRRK